MLENDIGCQQALRPGDGKDACPARSLVREY
jgi:hypothetical protein